MADIIVNIVSGFLGAGKTTAILNLLSHNNTGEKWAVIVNESGKVAIDGETLRSNPGEAKIYDVTGGCICCSAKHYFGDTLRQINETGEFSRIIIEPSGLGGIDMVSETVRSMPGLICAPVICMVDITLVDHPRFRLNPVYQAQVRKSDIVVFTKIDLVGEPSKLESLIGLFKLQFPDATSHKPGTTLVELITDSVNIENRNEKVFQIESSDPRLDDNNFSRLLYTCEAERIIDSNMIKSILEKFPGILRAKGHIRTDSGWMLMNYTLSGCSFLQCAPKERNQLIVISDKLVSGQEALMVPFLNKSVN
jgi:G3E family GTPase